MDRRADPRIALWEVMSQRCGSEGLRAVIRGCITQVQQQRAARAAAFPSPWGELPPPGMYDGQPIPIGTTPDGRELTLSPDDLNGPLSIVVGPARAGKSTLFHGLARHADHHGVIVISLDTKNLPQYQPGHPLPALHAGDLAIGLQPPLGASAVVFRERLRTIIEQTSFVQFGARYILEEWIALEHSGGPVMLSTIYERIQARLARASPWSKEAGYLLSAEQALRRICAATELFRGEHPLAWEARFTHSYEMRLPGETAEGLNVFTRILIESALQFARLRGWQDRQLRILMLLDDARVLMRRSGRPDHLEVDTLLDAADRGQSSGIAFVLAVQHLGEVDPGLLASANAIVLIGPMSELDIDRLKGRLDLTPDRRHWLLTQPVHQALVHVRRHTWPYPVPITLRPPPGPDEMAQFAHERQRRQEALLALRPAKPAPAAPTPNHTGRSNPGHAAPRKASPGQSSPATAPPSRPTPTASPSADSTAHPTATANPALDPKPHALLVALLQRPWLLQVELGSMVGVQGREITDLRDQLVARGFVRVHALGPLRLWEPTEAGAAAVGRSYGPLSGRGAYPHRWLQSRLAAKWKHEGLRRVEIEFDVPGVGSVDCYAERADGTCLAAEIVLSIETLDRAIHKLGAFNGERLLVVPDKKASASARAGLARLRVIRILTVRALIEASRPVEASSNA
jgi:hypothetical protein